MKDETIVQFLNGSKEGISAVVECYAPKLIAFLCNYVPKADAEDLTEESFLAVLEKKRSFPNEKAFSTYLYKTARNKALNFIRKHKRLVPLEEQISIDGLEECFDRKERIEALQRELSKLDAQTASILWFVYAEEYSYREVSQIVRLPVKKIDNLLSYAKKKLKVNLEELL